MYPDGQYVLLLSDCPGSGKFFLGTDSAPHPRAAKECRHGAAGCYTSFAAMPLLAEAFESVNALDKLENFSSVFGAKVCDLLHIGLRSHLLASVTALYVIIGQVITPQCCFFPGRTSLFSHMLHSCHFLVPFLHKLHVLC